MASLLYHKFHVDATQTHGSSLRLLSAKFTTKPYWYLTHWPQRDVAVIFNFSHFQTHIKDRYLEHSMWNCTEVNATRPHWWLVNISSGNDLMQPGNKQLPEPIILTKSNRASWWTNTQDSRSFATLQLWRSLTPSCCTDPIMLLRLDTLAIYPGYPAKRALPAMLFIWPHPSRPYPWP